MLLNKNLKINDKGHLVFANADTTLLAKEFGTPLKVLDKQGIKDNCNLYLTTLKKCFGDNATAAYASKALSFIKLMEVIKGEGMSLDVASIGEIYTAYLAGFDMQKVYYHSNYKSENDIDYAINKGIGFFMVDNFEELDAIEKQAKIHKKKQKVILRIAPNVSVYTHKKITTGILDTKFGVSLYKAWDFIKKAQSLPNLILEGLHCHIGSQIFEIEPFIEASKIMLRLIADTKIKIGTLVMGGGFAVKYVDKQADIDYTSHIEKLSIAMKDEAKKLGVEIPRIVLEPGRSIVANNGISLYSVGVIKEVEGIRNYIIVDGGMTDNPRYALYESLYTVYNASRMEDAVNYKATVAGRACESGDLIGEGFMLAKPQKDDVLAVMTTGAYTYSMASNYNKFLRPAIVMVDEDGVAELAVRREELDDLVQLDIK